MLPAWFWFLVAVLAAAGGAALLLVERRRGGDHSRDRRRWAEQKSWEFVDADPVLPSRWRYGSVAQGGPGRALDLATGAVPGPGGRRLAHVFDHEQAGQVTGIIAAVRGVAPLPVAVELRLPSAPLPDDAGLDSLGQVGDRYAFVTSVADARPLVTPEVARVADEVGDDVPLLWAEDAWTLASISTDADPERVQELLQTLVEVSAALEEALDAAGDGLSGRPSASGDDDGEDAGDDDGDDAADPAGPTETIAPADGWNPAYRNGSSGGADDIDDAEIDDDDIDDHGNLSSASAQGGHGGGTPRATHRDRPGDIPYDIEDDEPGSGTTGTRSGSSSGR